MKTYTSAVPQEKVKVLSKTAADNTYNRLFYYFPEKIFYQNLVFYV